MARLDGTGPEKKGSKSGRGLGKCRTMPKKKPSKNWAKAWGYAARLVADKEKVNALKAD
jgi:hypothetical protein